MTDLDLWAVRVVVREGRYMDLPHEERILAAHLLSRKGLKAREIGERLRLSIHAAYHLTRLPPPVPIDELMET